MCGIAGILYRDGTSASYPIGQSLLTMAACLQHRGADSAGIAVFTPSDALPSSTSIQVVLPGSLPEPQTILALGGGRLSHLISERNGFIATLSDVGDVSDDTQLFRDLEAGLPGSTVTAMGESLHIYKTLGMVSGLSDEAGALHGTHGIAHLRLATESRIDPAHAQPFWGRPYSDIAVTHNGHITNYHKLRKNFEARGYSFASHNDSEIIGLYLGEKMASGLSLKEALQVAGRELDGSYSFIVATAAGLGVVRDPFATKPLLVVETDGVVALASEQQALRRLLGDDVTIKEIRPREVCVWEKA